jgi:hypothetical protein
MHSARRKGPSIFFVEHKMTLNLQLSSMEVFSHCMWIVGPSDSNHAVEHALTDGKCHCTQFWLQEIQFILSLFPT